MQLLALFMKLLSVAPREHEEGFIIFIFAGTRRPGFMGFHGVSLS
jgi:hypothetical protein